jgi:fructosamine-3-kinase
MTLNLPDAVSDALREKIADAVGSSITIKSFLPTGGGCINATGTLITSGGNFFLKWNDREAYPNMFEHEAAGLMLLRKAAPLHVPEVITFDTTDKHQYLVLENIRSAPRVDIYWEELGRGIATLHKASASRFGLDHDNFIGSLVQTNTHSNSWVEFFIKQRLEIQLSLMKENGYGYPKIESQFHALYGKLPDLLPEDVPNLLHGDLWSGNVMVNQHGQPCIIDPAVYYGNNEVDLAMTRLFGGFPSEFYEAYQEVTPLADGFQERCEIYNLYPLMVHVNLFGVSYLSQVQGILDRFI